VIEGLSDQTREIDAPGAGYALAFIAGITLVGKLSDDGNEMSPVFELKAGLVRMQGGGPGLVHTAAPLLMLPSLDSFNLPLGTPIVPLVALSVDDQRAVMRAVEEGGKMADGIRMSQAGIVPAAAGMLANGRIVR